MLACIVALMLTAGCATKEVMKAPGADVSSLRAFYVQKLPADGRGIEKVISDQLSAMGYSSSYGVPDSPPTRVDAVVTYQDRWMWDITMYMIQLDMQIRDPDSRVVLASGKSYRPSLERKSPEGMAEEVLTEILKQ
jgi:hypothetical protein